MTSAQSWLPLAEYSMKHQVSISTLRRKIKAEDIQFRFDDGKYLILDEANQSQSYNHDALKSAGEHRPSLKSDVQNKSASFSAPPANVQAAELGESVITAANRLLSDLKKAYTQVLQEKESQIQDLRQEIADLKTLVKVLESENNRIRN
ncbi:MAG: hypothetical protein H7061_10995 [Bdellovibrionaceae bacterium]|nr:hypothetical protein [Bdellovibrio sp.]